MVRTVIGPSGGLVASHDDVLTLVFQPGALEGDEEIIIFPSDEPPAIFGPAYRVQPDIDLLVDVQVGYRRALPADPSGVAVSAITRDDYQDEMGHWVPLPRLWIDEDAGLIRASDSRLSLYYGLNEYNVVPGTTMGNTTNPTQGGSDTGDTDPSDTDPSDTDPSDTDPSDTDPTGTDPTGDPGCSNGNVEAGEVCFVSTDFDMTGGPVDVTLGDVNMDLSLDVATANGDGSYSLRLGDGNGGFGAETNDVAGNGPTAIAAGDLDAQNGADLVITLSGTNQMLLLQSQGNGTFGAIPPIALGGTAPSEVILADADGNGGPDILIANAGSNNVSFFPFPGGLGPETVYAIGPVAAPLGMSFGQYNQANDPNGDVFVFGGGLFSVLPGNGTNFMSAPLDGAVGTDLRRAVGGDFDGGPGEDAAVADFSQGGIHVLLGDGTPLGFTSTTFYPTGDGAVDVGAGDFNGDGDIDFAIANSGSDTVTLLFSVGNGAWGDDTDFPTGGEPSGVAVGDLNGDGVDDIVVSLVAGNGITVLASDP